MTQKTSDDMTTGQIVREYMDKETKLDMTGVTARLVASLLQDRGYRLMPTRASVGDRIVALVKKNEDE